MLPNIENVDDLLIKIEKTQEKKTLTFGIEQTTKNSIEQTTRASIYDDGASSGILGLGVLGKLTLNEYKVRQGTAEQVIGGKIDGLAALQQHIYLTLNIEADQYIIYPYTYGIKTLDLIGQPYYYVIAVIPGRIKEALSDDERITSVSDFEFEVCKNKLHVKFVIHTIYGDINEEMEVKF